MPFVWMTILLALGLSGCVSANPTVEPVETQQGLEQTAHQVRRCYRAPAVPSAARQIITILRVKVTPEGDLAALPMVVAQQSVTAANQPYAGRMAQAAIGAILRCAPLRLPESFRRNIWGEFDLTFSPLAAG